MDWTSDYEALAKALFAYVLRHVRSVHDAEDIVSDSFEVAFRSDVRDALPFLIGTARHRIADLYRGEFRHEEVRERLLALTGTSVPGADRQALARHELVEALTHLTSDERDTVLLVAWDGLTARQAGEVLGLSSVAVRVRLHRIRQKLATFREDPTWESHENSAISAPRPQSS